MTDPIEKIPRKAMKLRTLSTALGIILGISALTASFNFTETARREILKTVEGLNSSLMVVKNWIDPQNKVSRSSPLTSYDLEILLKSFSSLEQGSSLKIRYSTIPPILNQTFSVIGADPALFSILKMKCLGRYFTDYENQKTERICLIGKKAKMKFFSKRDPIGKFLKIWNTDFLIIGVIEASDKTPYADPMESFFIPYKTLNMVTNAEDFPDMLLFKRKDTVFSSDYSENIKGLLNRNKPNQNFEIWDQSELISKKKKTVLIIEWLVNSIPLLILFVACISSANILIVTVTERTKEIGLRMALGATQKDILLMFLKEGLILFGIAGGMGIILGYYLTLWFVKPLPSLISGYQTWTFTFSLASVIKSMIVLFISALVSSLVPAIKAARLEPSMALRYE